jgi:hypothetical protein
MFESRERFEDGAPVTWLASYPRSGNTLLRIVLNRCFGVSSQSIYADVEFPDPAVRGEVGHEAIGDDPKGFLAAARRSGRSLYVKTHELPSPDRHPVLYVLRDGRSAVVSHAHYMSQFFHRDVPLTDIIAGKLGASWSQHVNAWLMGGRPNLLVVRYEDLAVGKRETLAAISAFIARPLVHAYDIQFDRLHALDPVFFRRGSDQANIGELAGEARALFDRLHGPTLHALGYAADAPIRAPVNVRF